MNDSKRATFVRGLLLAWLPSLLVAFRALRWVPDSYASIGLASAGGIALYAIPILPCEVAAVFFLLKSFSRTHPLRALVTVATVLWSVSLITLFLRSVFSAIDAAF